jgi:Ca2+:H+ antiporter
LAYLLLGFVPLSALLEFWFGAAPIWVFATSAVAVAVLAHWISAATEDIAEQAGSTIGGLLNISFGSIAELVLAIFVLIDGHVEVVRAQITGSIIGTALLGLGLAIMVGGFSRPKQVFRRERAGLLSSLLVLLLIALLLPAVFDLALKGRPGTHDIAWSNEELSLGMSAVLLLLYGGNLVYTLVTHRDVFSGDEPRKSKATPSKTSLLGPIAVLVIGTVAIAFEAELVSGALEATASQLHLSTLFLGVVVLALVGTSADLFAAVVFAARDKMGLVMEICLGSAIQVALVIAPLLTVIGFFIGKPMNLAFTNPLDLFSFGATALVVHSVAADGETTWFEGLLLVGIYVLLGLAFFFVG